MRHKSRDCASEVHRHWVFEEWHTVRVSVKEMLALILLFVCSAFASGPPVVTDPDECRNNLGYLNGADFGEDCCSFVVCDSVRLNRTGFVGKCTGGTGWNDELKVCDDKIYLDNCDPANDCDIPSRTTALCSAPQPTATTCCLGQRIGTGFPGYEPVYEMGSDEFHYRRVGERGEGLCPKGMIFILDSCCCEEPETEPIAPCDDLSSFFFDNPNEACCSYVQCFVNRTAYVIESCMPPSVWNSVNKTCDIRVNVPECANALCGPEMTDPPCDDPPSQGDCCSNGNYFQAEADPIQYVIVGGPAASDRLQLCPVDIDGNQLVFNNDPDTCACEIDADFK
ncbi:unnamed protein product [Owenia fusiformis]|uniref:Uncharacterized protein n=1 Tax=Owenia fusiformis TaxID=6347 RepID=A0A8J1UAG8_OWEFU|nr:unnamed protein product [Owenia fusiformis]